MPFEVGPHCAIRVPPTRPFPFAGLLSALNVIKSRCARRGSGARQSRRRSDVDDVPRNLEARRGDGPSRVRVLVGVDQRDTPPDDVHDNLVVLLSPALALVRRCRIGAAITLDAIEEQHSGGVYR